MIPSILTDVLPADFLTRVREAQERHEHLFRRLEEFSPVAAQAKFDAAIAEASRTMADGGAGASLPSLESIRTGFEAQTKAIEGAMKTNFERVVAELPAIEAKVAPVLRDFAAAREEQFRADLATWKIAHEAVLPFDAGRDGRTVRQSIGGPVPMDPTPISGDAIVRHLRRLLGSIHESVASLSAGNYTGLSPAVALAAVLGTDAADAAELLRRRGVIGKARDAMRRVVAGTKTEPAMAVA